MTDTSRFGEVGTPNRVATGGKPQLERDCPGEREPSPSLPYVPHTSIDAWVTVRQGARLVGKCKSTLLEAALRGQIRHRRESRRVVCGVGHRIKPVWVLYIADLLAYRPRRYDVSGPATAPTVDRLMAVLLQVARGQTWPRSRQESAMLITDDYTKESE